MKKIIRLPILILLLTLFAPGPLFSADMRAISLEAAKTKQELLEKIAREKKEAGEEAAKSKAEITRDKAKLNKAIKDLEAKNTGLAKNIERMAGEIIKFSEKTKELTLELAKTDAVIQELVGVIRVNAKDLDALLIQNPRSAESEEDTSYLSALAEESRFPGMEDVRAMSKTLVDLTRSYGEVVVKKGDIVNREGKETPADILYVGPFITMYRSESSDANGGIETGFLNFSSTGKKLYALSKLPPKKMEENISQYMDGNKVAVPLDITRGAALRQLTHELSLFEQVPKGGPLVWPIVGIFAIGILIILERMFFLIRKRINADSLMNKIETLALEKNWRECRDACAKYCKKPVARVVGAGLLCSHMEREEMENALQEAILKEIPPMERFLSTLGMLAAIAPLFGLLGTVTGMIDTFHVITLHGTGDPRLMSGGISEALVTTMLGLAVAIPLMLAQTLLTRAVDNSIGQMEEKAVSLVNIVYKSRETA